MQHQYEHAGPSLVERLERRVFKVKQKKKILDLTTTRLLVKITVKVQPKIKVINKI